MEKDKLRPEWVPSAYSGADKVEKKDNVEKEEAKPIPNNHKNAIIGLGFKRRKVK